MCSDNQTRQDVATENVEEDSAALDPTPWQKALADDILQVVVSAATPAKPRHTPMGTRCAQAWDDQWVKTVEVAEDRLGHPICGARTMAGNPCELESNHSSGRCRFHGGFPLTGAPDANRNAVIHGLYSRRLKVCDSTCPLWKQCPCAGRDVDALPAPDRPTCPYEQTEYNTALTDALARAATNPHPDPFTLHIAHNLALLQVMLSRAALAMRQREIVDINRTDTPNCQMTYRQPTAYLTAFLRISSEFRRFAKMIEPRRPIQPIPEDTRKHIARSQADTQLDPDQFHRDQPLNVPSVDQAVRHIRQAIDHAAAGRDVAMLECFEAAYSLAPQYTEQWEDKLFSCYRPGGESRRSGPDSRPFDTYGASAGLYRPTRAPKSHSPVLPEDAVKKILEHIMKRGP